MSDIFRPIVCQSVTHFGLSHSTPTNQSRPLGHAQNHITPTGMFCTDLPIIPWKCMVPFEYEKLYGIVSKIYIMTFCCSNNFIGLENNSNLIKLNPSVGEHSKSKRYVPVKIATVAARQAGTVEQH